MLTVSEMYLHFSPTQSTTSAYQQSGGCQYMLLCARCSVSESLKKLPKTSTLPLVYLCLPMWRLIPHSSLESNDGGRVEMRKRMELLMSSLLTLITVGWPYS